ncbi:MAG: hypothetical protein LBB59_06285 [Campylobacteraceae bacterium]|nr:hypothetical protein [Campylobacteraceae bacterium]
MIIIGHELIDFKPFCKIKNIDKTANISSDLAVIFAFKNGQNLIKFCQKNGINFAVETEIAKEALLANAAGASYISVSGKKAAKKIQDLAENYLFDAKILLKINNENEIEKAAKLGIDGVLLPEGVIDGDI